MAKSKSRPKKGVADKVRAAKLAKAKNVFKVQTNPFEVKINKQKHKILGRKTKHDRGLPGVSRSKANKKRKDTLLNEYKKRHNTNVVVDERFGEGDTNLSVEEKMLQRFAIEKKRKHEKMSLFNLNDEEEELTHYGQSLASIQDFGDGDESDDNDTGEIAGEYVSEAHFGGGIFRKVERDEPDGKKEAEAPKSRKEVIEEIIMKSKKAKLEKQNARDETNELREKLDSTWQEVEKLLKTKRTKKDKERIRDSFQPDAYDVAVKQMQYDRKAAPAPRGKSEAELAAERKENLRRLEEERIKRMKENHGDATPKPSHRSADDLNYDFLPEKITVEPVWYKDGVMVGAEPLVADGTDDGLLEPESMNEQDANASDEEEHDSESQDDGADSDSGEDDYSDIFSDEEQRDSDDEASDEDAGGLEDADPGGNRCRGKGKVKHKDGGEKTKNQEVQSFPERYEDFDNLVRTKYQGNTDEYISHLRAKFSAELAKGNKDKLQKLFQYVWQYLYSFYRDEMPQTGVVDTLVRHLYELCQGSPTECARFVLDDMRSTYNECLDRGGKMRIPGFAHLMKFKLIKILFSTSDFFHPVATSATIFMCHILHSNRPSDLSEIASCLFTCTLLYEYVCFSRRFVPECLNYLCAVICMAVPKVVQRAKGLPAAASLHLNSKNCELLVPKGDIDDITVENGKPDLMKLVKSKEVADDADVVRVQLLATSLKLSLKFVGLYAQMPCFKEIHAPLKAACARCIAANGRDKSKKHPSTELLYEVQAEIQRLVKKRPTLERLVKVEDNRPKPLPLYDPKFEDIKREPFSKGGKNVSAAKRERARLQHKYKREMKGAVREIKKDARFLAREQLEEQMEKDRERAEKVKRLYGFLSNQEGEVKKINRKRFKLGT